jgi:uncharacterized protein YggE
LAARALCAAADEALTEASFRTADFAEAERLFTEARDLAVADGDRGAEALALTGLGLTLHGRATRSRRAATCTPPPRSTGTSGFTTATPTSAQPKPSGATSARSTCASA